LHLNGTNELSVPTDDFGQIMLSSAVVRSRIHRQRGKGGIEHPGKCVTIAATAKIITMSTIARLDNCSKKSHTNNRLVLNVHRTLINTTIFLCNSFLGATSSGNTIKTMKNIYDAEGVKNSSDTQTFSSLQSNSLLPLEILKYLKVNLNKIISKINYETLKYLFRRKEQQSSMSDVKKKSVNQVKCAGKLVEESPDCRIFSSMKGKKDDPINNNRNRSTFNSTSGSSSVTECQAMQHGIQTVLKCIISNEFRFVNKSHDRSNINKARVLPSVNKCEAFQHRIIAQSKLIILKLVIRFVKWNKAKNILNKNTYRIFELYKYSDNEENFRIYLVTDGLDTERVDKMGLKGNYKKEYG
jgi:hypothetical protein